MGSTQKILNFHQDSLYMKQKNIPTLCIALLIAIAYLSTYLQKAPKANYEDPNFNLKKAEEQLQTIAREVHPIASLEHTNVRNHIVNEAQKMGYKIQVDTTADYQSWGNYEIITDVFNIIISKPGTNPKGTIAFAAHYDSQPNTPGAADDAAPVSCMLSIMESIKDKSYENDLVFLITDAEETGLNGASVFTQSNPLAPKLNYLFNFEARGNSGPVLGFEPNEKNNYVMDMFLDMDHTIASSLMYDVYRLMPNNTDFTHFKKLDLGGISMALVDGYVNYHSMTDTPENMDKSSLYHYGSIMTQIIDRLGNDDLKGEHSYDMTYFNTLGYHSVQYRPFWNLVLLLLSCVLFYFYILQSQKKINFLKILLGLMDIIFWIALSLALVYLFAFLLKIIYPHYTAFYNHNFYNAMEYFPAFTALSTILFLMISMYRKKENVINIHLGGLVFLFILSGVSYVFIPTGSYIFIVPLFSFLAIQQGKKFVTINKAVWIDTLSIIIPTILMAPIVYMMYITFSLIAAVIPMLIYSLLMIFYMPLFIRGLRLWTMLLASLFILVCIRGHMSSTITEERPYQANWTYMNDDKEERIVMKDDVLDRVEKKYFPNAELMDGKYIEKRTLGLAKPVTYTVQRDSLAKELLIRFTGDKEVIHMRMWGYLLEESEEIQMKGKRFRVKTEDKNGRNGGVQYYGDVMNKELLMRIRYSEFPENGEFWLETVQRGLIEILDINEPIIPGTGYTGGTIIHRYKVKI